jgi:hypothetical protein
VANSLDYVISIEQRLKGDRAADELKTAEDAVKKGIDAYKNLEQSALKTAQAVEQANAKLAEANKALEAAKGDKNEKAIQAAQKAVDKYAGSIEKLAAANAALEAAKAGGNDKSIKAAQKEVDKQTSAVAKLTVAQKALESAQAGGNPKAIEAAQKSVDKYTKSVKEATKAHEDANRAMKAHRGELEKKADAMEKARQASKKTSLADKVAKSEIFDLETAFKDLGGPVGNTIGRAFEMGEAFKRLAGMGGGMGLLIGGAVVATAVVVALTVALVAGIAALAKMAVATANAARNQHLTLTAMFESSKTASELQATYVNVAKATGVSVDRQVELTKQLQKAKVAAKDMPAALRAIATQEAAIGADETDELVKKLGAGSVAANKLAKDIEQKYGGIVRQKMIGLDQLWERFKVTVAETFGGLKIEGLLKQLSGLVDMFDQSTASGRAMGAIFRGIFQPLVDGATTAIPYVRLAILEFLITCVRAYIAIKPLINAVKEFFGIETDSDIDVALQVGRSAAIAMMVAVGLLTAGLLVLALAAVAVALPFIIIGAVIYGVVQVIKLALAGIKGELAKYDPIFKASGTNWMNSLAMGVTAGSTTVNNSVAAGGEAAIAALAKVDKSASPSKVFIERGGWWMEGLAIGIDRNVPLVKAAVQEAMPSDDGAQAAPVGGSQSINITANIYVQGGSTSSDTLDNIKTGVTNFFEGISLQLGRPVTQ